ncbi:class I SAM-dependent methyltransferase [Gracilimonas sp. Q87]|uniref:class I SAM-dependent methyltransferase n=1 Tax=Gracilimonas sp. Q87 TaxID=3384766 RepID=UPI003984491E
MSKKLTSESYSKDARNYEETWANYLDHTHAKLLAEFKSNPDDEILDVSAGTGLFAEHLIEAEYEFDTMTLNDVSAGMLKLARQRFEGRVDLNFTCFFAEELGFEDSAFDIVISMSAFHNYAEQEKALHQIHRVLKADGCFYLLDWNRTGLFSLINYGISKMVPEIINTRSATETRKMLNERTFRVMVEKEWRYKYWEFYLFKAFKE